MFKFTVTLFVAALACSSALTHIGPTLKKQAIYNNGVPTNYAQTPANIQAAFAAQQLAARATVGQPAEVSAQPSQNYLAAVQQTSAAQQIPYATTQSGQPLLSLSQYAAKQQLPSQQLPSQQFPSYYPQQYFPQQALYPASTNGQNVLSYTPARFPQGSGEQGGITYPQFPSEGFQSGSFPSGGFPSNSFPAGSYPSTNYPGASGSQYPISQIPQLGGSQYPFQQFPSQYPQYPSQYPQYPGQYPPQYPSQYPTGGGFPAGQFPGQLPSAPSNNGPGSADAVVTTSPGSDGGNSDANQVVIGSRFKPDKPEAGDASQEIQKSETYSSPQQYTALPQSQYPGQLAAVQDPVQLNSAAKGAVSSYLIGQTQPQLSQAQLYQQPQASAQQYVPQLALPQQLLRQQPQLFAQPSLPQQISAQYAQQTAPQKPFEGTPASDAASYAYQRYLLQSKQRSDDYSQSSNEVGPTPSYAQGSSQGSTTPSYSKPSGVSLFAELERDLKTKRCKNDIEIRAAIGKWFHEQPKEFYDAFRKRIQSIEQRAQ